MNIFFIIFTRKYDFSPINIFLHLSIGQVVQVVTIEADQAEGVLHLSQIWLDICRNTWISPLPFHSQLVVTAVAPGKLQIIRFLLSKPGDWQIFMRCKIVCIFTSKLALSQFSACQWFRIMVFVWIVDCSWGHGSWPSDGEWHICQYGRLVPLSAKQKESNHYQGRVEVSHLL